jgi:hypothetical protein
MVICQSSVSSALYILRKFYSIILLSLAVTIQAAVEREVELEHRAVEASSALARIQVILQGIIIIMIYIA